MAKMTKAHCEGCRENFYNGNNPLGVSECWNFKTAKLIRRKRVGLGQTPPWKQPAGVYPSCYSQPGAVFVGPNQEH